MKAAPVINLKATTTIKCVASRFAATFLFMLTALVFLSPARSFVVQQTISSSRHHRYYYQYRKSSAVNSVFSLATKTLRGGGESTRAHYSTTTTSLAMASGSSGGSKPFAVVVTAEIRADRMEEFLEMIQFNAENSRKEPGCIRFGTCSDC